jgi:CDP-diacylglycerol--glycerol-3-phosphate 3-phosphatidyltransferase
MLPSLISAIRVALAFVNIALYRLGFAWAVAAVVLTLVVIWMDALDGWVARRTGQASDMGALIDITGDRIVENVYWIYFATAGLVSVWVPIVVITRGFLTDTIRTLQFEQGRTPFGEKTMMRSGWSRFVVAGRFMRGLYGGAKLVSFCALGANLALRQGVESAAVGPRALHILEPWTQVVVGLTVALCVVRGLPVLWDGRDVLRRLVPRSLD